MAGLQKAIEGLKLILKKGPAFECTGGGGSPVHNPCDISFEEQWTGAYDRTDGNRKIYSKTIDCGDISNADIYLTPLNIPNFRNIWIANGWAEGLSFVVQLPHAGIDPYPISIVLNLTNQSVQLMNNLSRTSVHAYAMVYYTKNE